MIILNANFNKDMILLFKIKIPLKWYVIDKWHTKYLEINSINICGKKIFRACKIFSIEQWMSKSSWHTQFLAKTVRQMTKTRIKLIIYQRKHKCHMYIIKLTLTYMVSAFFLGVKLETPNNNQKFDWQVN